MFKQLTLLFFIVFASSSAYAEPLLLNCVWENSKTEIVTVDLEASTLAFGESSPHQIVQQTDDIILTAKYKSGAVFSTIINRKTGELKHAGVGKLCSGSKCSEFELSAFTGSAKCTVGF